jgi:hypothetical protein
MRPRRNSSDCSGWTNDLKFSRPLSLLPQNYHLWSGINYWQRLLCSMNKQQKMKMLLQLESKMTKEKKMKKMKRMEPTRNNDANWCRVPICITTCMHIDIIVLHCLVFHLTPIHSTLLLPSRLLHGDLLLFLLHFQYNLIQVNMRRNSMSYNH